MWCYCVGAIVGMSFASNVGMSFVGAVVGIVVGIVVGATVGVSFAIIGMSFGSND